VAEHIAVAEDNLFQYAMGGLHQPSAGSDGKKLEDTEVIARMSDRSNKAQAPAEFQPSGRFKTKDELVQHFLASRDRNIRYVETTPENLRGTLLKSPMGTIDVYQMLLMIPAHTERHLAQIKEVKSSPGYPKR
jgi:hypothetical protein